MNRKLSQIDDILGRIERLADELRADPDGHVRRSANELRTAFGSHTAMEPAVSRLLESIQMLRRGNEEGSRREFQRRATGLDHLGTVIDDELLPELRRLGFEV